MNSEEIEAALRAEFSVHLIRQGYRLYRPEADVDGEDLVVRDLSGHFLQVQLKSRITVEEKYLGLSLWVGFPHRDKYDPSRSWYLAPHDELFQVVKQKPYAFRSDGTWSQGTVPGPLLSWLKSFRMSPSGENAPTARAMEDIGSLIDDDEEIPQE